ncbi:hypothetical protein ACTVMJ_01090, partial [Serratia marcescens]
QTFGDAQAERAQKQRVESGAAESAGAELSGMRDKRMRIIGLRLNAAHNRLTCHSLFNERA